ncbi:MAG: chloride channel protein [Opitutales bacterium]|jgi:H+/Cl- antiporter ClcA|nr:chloride channel protein [Opitutales bacterium]MDP4860815.1 chloride channel protein [Opitutales bacterium]MDP4895345.1 chloride channel protein [Opitutales bacterium]
MDPLSPKSLLRWTTIILAVSLVVGAAGAGFLHALEAVTALYRSTPWLLVSLPFIGLLTVWLYKGPLKASAGGVKTLIAQIKDPTSPLPAAMGPSIIGTTLLSHLGGASVGREGTALQMGGAIADQGSRWIELNESERRALILCGVSAGFAAVFGTPIAAAIFALEFVRQRSWAIIPCLATAYLADLVGRKLFFATHANYRLPAPATYDLKGLGSAVALGLVCGGIAWFYVWLSRREAARPNPEPYARIFFTGTLFSAAIYFHHSADLTGLGLPVIESALVEPAAPLTFVFKFLFTIICVSAGFRGGEVTPLFFVGATLGSAAAVLSSLPLSICAALGFVAVFAGAGAVPLACAVMACELFGWSIGGYALVACAVSWLMAGRKGLYDEA